MFDHQKKSPFTFARLLAMSLILSLFMSQTFGFTQSDNSSSEKKKATESKGRYSAEAGKEKPKEENIKPVAMAGKATLLGQNEKKGKFPWLIVGAATVVVGVIVVLLLTKKKESKTNTHEKYEFMMKWGGWGDGDDQFIHASGIAVDLSNYIYITDIGGWQYPDKVKKFTGDGSFVTAWGGHGSSNGQFEGLGGIAADSSGYIYVIEQDNHRLQKFRSDGSFVTKWGNWGNADDQFIYPSGIAVDSSNYIYITDQVGFPSPAKIMKFTSDGSFIKKWGGELSSPGPIAVDSSGYVYVADSMYIHKFTRDGSFIMRWGGLGTGDGEFNYPLGIAVDSLGYVYVTDNGNNRVQKFTNSGSFVTKWGTMGSTDGQFDNPEGIAVDSSGCVYVVDSGNSRIQKFRPVSSNAVHDRQNSSLSLSDKGILPTPLRTNGLKNGGSRRGNK